MTQKNYEIVKEYFGIKFIQYIINYNGELSRKTKFEELELDDNQIKALIWPQYNQNTLFLISSKLSLPEFILFINSAFNVLKKLSTGALSQQFPVRLMEIVK